MGNKHEVLGFKVKLWGSGAKPPVAKGNRRSGGGGSPLVLFGGKHFSRFFHRILIDCC